MSDELQDVINSNSEWYKDLLYKDVKIFIKDNINSASRSFVAIGYYLKYVRDNQLYKEDGYTGVSEFAKAEFSISPAQASKFMSINDRFSKDGNSPVLLEQYKDFSSSKLSEMLYLTDEQLEQVAITTTRAEIRDMVNPDRFSHAKTEPDCFIRDQINNTREDERKCSGGISEDCQSCDKADQTKKPSMDYLNKLICGWSKRNMTVELYELAKSTDPEDMEVFLRYFRERYIHDGFAPSYNLPGYENAYRLDKDGIYFDDEYKTEYPWEMLIDQVCYADEKDVIEASPTNLHENQEGLKRLKEIRKEIRSQNNFIGNPKPDDHSGIVNNISDIVDNELEIMNDVDKPLLSELDEMVLDCYNNEEGWHKEIISSEPDQVETVEADIIQTVPDDPEQYTYQDIKDEHDKLTEYVDVFRRNNDTVPGRRKAKMRLDAITLLDKEMRKQPIIEEPEPAQPELPILKNNDQRKEWAENYKAWGEWYYDEHIDCHYYKYDFLNGDRLVVEEYLDREHYWGNDRRDEQYYHLIQKNRKKYEKNKTYEKKYSHDTASMTEIVDYLKELQKK